MPKSLEEIKTILTERKADDIYGDILANVEAEKTRGIEEKRKVNSEAQGLRKYKIAIEKVAQKHGIENFDDVDSMLDEVFTKAKTADEGGKAIKDKDVLSKRLEALERKLVETEQKEKQTKAKAKSTVLLSRLKADLDAEIYAAEDVINSRLIARNAVDLLDDGETIQFVNGEERIEYKSGLAKFLADNPDIRKNKQTGGAGSSPNNSREAKSMAFTEWNKLSGIEKAKFFEAGGKLE